MLVNLSNPKVILFILAFVPQFITPDAPVLPQFLVFGGVLSVGGFVINGLVGIFAGRIGKRIRRNSRAERGLRTLSAGIFGTLALRIGWEAARP